MVMETPPSPQSVGREFVRQYYTLLNGAPDHLHRFYNHQSSFIHGGIDPRNRETSTVVGQKQIHQKIQQLSFRDCHAKITQVDSQATLGEGVVVQVTGELSNAGQPMRRFTQTFVLAAQSPKKYYVHNDIFRYQDEIISDEECDVENRSEPDDEPNQECPVLPEIPQPAPQPLNQPPMQYYNAQTTAIQSNIPQPVPPHHQPPHVLAAQAVPTVNGVVHPEDINVLAEGVQPMVGAAQSQVQGTALPILTPSGLVQPSLNPPVSIAENSHVVEPTIEETREINYNDTTDNETQQQIQEINPEPVVTSHEPKTYANLLKSGNNMPFSNQQVTPQLQIQSQRPTTPPSIGNRDQGNLNNKNIPNRPGPRVTQQQQQRLPRQDSNKGNQGRNPFNEDGSYEERKRQQSSIHNDTNQLFLGNLPHLATEEELRDIFCEFGKIVDLKILSKPNSVRTTPNYGFITYESHQAIMNCLGARPIYYPKDSAPNGTALNVEKKRRKEDDRPMFSGGGRPNNDNRIRDNGPRRSGGPGGMGQNRNNLSGGSGGGGVGVGPGMPPNRPNNYNRSGGPPNRGQNNYVRR